MPVNRALFQLLAIAIALHGVFQAYLGLNTAYQIHSYNDGSVTRTTIALGILIVIGILEIIAGVGLYKYKQFGFYSFYSAVLISCILWFYVVENAKVGPADYIIATVALAYVIFEHTKLKSKHHAT